MEVIRGWIHEKAPEARFMRSAICWSQEKEPEVGFMRRGQRFGARRKSQRLDSGRGGLW